MLPFGACSRGHKSHKATIGSSNLSHQNNSEGSRISQKDLWVSPTSQLELCSLHVLPPKRKSAQAARPPKTGDRTSAPLQRRRSSQPPGPKPTRLERKNEEQTRKNKKQNKKKTWFSLKKSPVKLSGPKFWAQGRPRCPGPEVAPAQTGPGRKLASRLPATLGSPDSLC